MYGYGLYIVGIVFSLFWVIFNNDRSEEWITMRYNLKITITLSIISLIISAFYSIYLRISWFWPIKMEYYFWVLTVSLVFILMVIPWIHGFINRKIIKDVSFRRLNNYWLYIGFCCLIILIITATWYFDDAYWIV
jgi:hypothetical protein